MRDQILMEVTQAVTELQERCLSSNSRYVLGNVLSSCLRNYEDADVVKREVTRLISKIVFFDTLSEAEHQWLLAYLSFMVELASERVRDVGTGVRLIQ